MLNKVLFKIKKIEHFHYFINLDEDRSLEYYGFNSLKVNQSSITLTYTEKALRNNEVNFNTIMKLIMFSANEEPKVIFKCV